MQFLDQDREKKLNDMLLWVSRQVIVQSAVDVSVIEDDDLAMIPEAVSILVQLAGTSRDDIFKNSPNTGIQFQMIQKVFCYNFAKGAESAFLWNLSSDGKFSFSYQANDAISGLVGAEVTPEFQQHINEGIPKMQDVFCDFQDKFIADPKYKFNQGGRWLADGIACGLFWASQVGIDFGMKRLGFE